MSEFADYNGLGKSTNHRPDFDDITLNKTFLIAYQYNYLFLSKIIVVIWKLTFFGARRNDRELRQNEFRPNIVMTRNSPLHFIRKYIILSPITSFDYPF